MKKLIIIMCFAITTVSAFAQKEETEKKGLFKKENLFAGGTINLGFGSGTTSFGIGPFLGYSINKYVDVALSLNYNYVSQKQYIYDYGINDYVNLGKIRQNTIGPGAFVRVFPVSFIYAQAQVERNFITQKFLPSSNSGLATQKESINVNSFLVGAGFASGREEDEKSYGYISILFDVAKNPYSPYLDGYGKITPIFRAGYNIALFNGEGGGNRRHRRSKSY